MIQYFVVRQQEKTTMRKYIAVLLAAALAFSGCNKDTESPFKPTVIKEVFADTEDGFNVLITKTRWLEEDWMECLEAQIRTEELEVIAEYDLIFPWISKVKEIHLDEHQSLNYHGFEGYQGGMVIIAGLETRHEDRTFTNEIAIFLCNGKELKDVTPYDSDGNPPVISNDVFDLGAPQTESVIGFTDIDGNIRRFELDFENLTMTEIN